MKNKLIEKEIEGVDIMAQLRKNWFIIAAIASTIVLYANMSYNVQSNTDRIIKLENQQALTTQSLGDINTNLAKIQTTLLFIQQSLATITKI